MTTDNKVYILQKDLPGGLKAGERFIYDGDSWYDSEHADDYGEINHYIPRRVENNPEWFKPEENKSNDSFQDALKVVLDYFDKDTTNVPMEVYKKVFNTLYPPKPQAEKVYDKNFGDNRKCECGHSYYRHFDTYENMSPVGCKYCPCDEFKEAAPQAENNPEWEIVALFGRGMVFNLIDWRNHICYTEPVWEASGHQVSFKWAMENDFTIHSVKRISDGEVFSVGDEVDCTEAMDSFKRQKIKKFAIASDGHMRVDCAGVNCSIQYIKKPQPQKEEQENVLLKSEWNKTLYLKPTEQRIEVDVDLPLGITMREIASCMTNYVRKAKDPIIPDAETTVIDHKKLEEICKTKMRKMFTQQQVDAMCEDAFNEGGLYEAEAYTTLGLSVGEQYKGKDPRIIYRKKHPTFQDYKKSKQNQFDGKNVSATILDEELKWPKPTQEANPPLTEDKIPLFYGDVFWVVDLEFKKSKLEYRGNDNHPKYWPHYKFFGREKAADQYIIENKPLNLSMKEIASCITNYVKAGSFPQEGTAVIDWKKLDEIIKSKL